MRMLLSAAAGGLTRGVHTFSSSRLGSPFLSQFMGLAIRTQDRIGKFEVATSSTTQLRSFAAKAAEKTKKKKKDETSYWEQKAAAKDRRRDLFFSRQARKERLKVRRAGKPKDQKKREFRSFFIRKKVDDEFMSRKARQAGLDWKVHVGVILIRAPLELPNKDHWELDYDQMKAYLNQFGKMYPEEFVGNVDYTTVIPMEDFAMKNDPCETEADLSGDLRTTNRKLKDNLYLTVQENGGKDDPWRLPTAEIKDDETFVQAARRVVAEKVGSEVQFWCPSNCPFSIDMESFSEEEQKRSGCYGVKTFFMRVNYNEGSVSETDKSVSDFAWLDRGEVVAKIKEQQGEPKSKFYHYML